MNRRLTVLLLGLLLGMNIVFASEEPSDPPSTDERDQEASGKQDMDPPADEPVSPVDELPSDKQMPIKEQPEESSIAKQPEPVAPDTVDPEIKELSAPRLFAKSKEGVVSRKEMIAGTDENERNVRQILQRIDTIKSKQLSAYLALDKQMDTFYDDVGLVRGKVSDDIDNIKKALWKEMSISGADDSLQKEVAEREQKVNKLEADLTDLSRKEHEVVLALKELSSSTNDAFDKGAQMYSRRLELRGIVDDAAAKSMYEQIKGVEEQVAKVEKDLMAPEGIVTKLEKAIADAQAQMNSVKESLAVLEKISAGVKEKIKNIGTARQQKKAATTADDVAVAGDETNADTAVSSKKKMKKKRSRIERLVRGTSLESVYSSVTGVTGVIWDSLKPVRNVFLLVAEWLKQGVVMAARAIGGGAEQAPTQLDETPKDDPVLERIRQERNQAYKNAEKLKKQEQERIKQLTGAKDQSGEMSWQDLGKNFATKLWASMGRGMQRVVAWWSGEELPIVIGRKAQKKTKASFADQKESASVKKASDLPATTETKLATELAKPVLPAPKKVVTVEGAVVAETKKIETSVVPEPAEPDLSGMPATQSTDLQTAKKEAAKKVAQTQTPKEKAAMAVALGGKDAGAHVAKVLLSDADRAAATKGAQNAADQADAAIKAAQRAAKASADMLK